MTEDAAQREQSDDLAGHYSSKHTVDSKTSVTSVLHPSWTDDDGDDDGDTPIRKHGSDYSGASALSVVPGARRRPTVCKHATLSGLSLRPERTPP